MDPSPVERARAQAASRAHLVMALASLPFVAAGVGALTACAHVVPSTLGAVALALATLSGPLAAAALRWSTTREEPVVVAPVPPPPVIAHPLVPPRLTPHQRWARDFVAWRETPFRR